MPKNPMFEAEYESIVLVTPYGHYVWWPVLALVDFVSKGKRRGIQVDSLSSANNHQLGAVTLATKHFTQMLKEKKADQRYKEEMSGITDFWRD